MKSMCVIAVLVAVASVAFADEKVQCFDFGKSVGDTILGKIVVGCMTEVGEPKEVGSKTYVCLLKKVAGEKTPIAEMKEKLRKFSVLEGSKFDKFVGNAFTKDTLDAVGQSLDDALSPKCNDDDKFNETS